MERVEVWVKDPLSEVTRRERKYLLGISTLTYAIIQTGLIPEKISALGIEFGKADQKSLINILILIIGYFLFAFIVYAIADYMGWRVLYNSAMYKSALADVVEKKSTSSLENRDEYNKSRYDQWLEEIRIKASKAHHIARPVLANRVFFDIAFPIVIGIYVCINAFSFSKNIDKNGIEAQSIPTKIDSVQVKSTRPDTTSKLDSSLGN